MKKQFSFIALILSLTLTACSESTYQKVEEKIGEKVANSILKDAGVQMEIMDSKTPLPEQPPILTWLSDEEIKNKIAENQAYINSKIVEPDGQTIYYFQKEEQDKKTVYKQTDDKNNAQYYRVVLGKTAEKHCAVQDFYANGEKRTEAYIIVETDCTQFSNNHGVATRQERNYLTHASYRPQEQLEKLTVVDVKNKTVDSYVNSNPDNKDADEKNWTAQLIIHYDYNLNQQQAFFFNKNKEIKDTLIRNFNQQQITEQTYIYNIPEKEDEKDTSVELASKKTNIDFEKSTFETIKWEKKDSGKNSVIKSKLKVMQQNDNQDKALKNFKNNYQNFIRVKRLIEKQ
ncbi:MAG: hypothetical protein IK065_04390 [Neisseriaceae bacterium]|nr:hypothetical protein [Neisseriaceae bacterium]